MECSALVQQCTAVAAFPAMLNQCQKAHQKHTAAQCVVMRHATQVYRDR